MTQKKAKKSAQVDINKLIKENKALKRRLDDIMTCLSKLAGYIAEDALSKALEEEGEGSYNKWDQLL